MPFMVRTPMSLGEAVRAEAERLDLTYSDYITNVLAAAHGFPPVASVLDDEGQMQLSA